MRWGNDSLGGRRRDKACPFRRQKRDRGGRLPMDWLAPASCLSAHSPRSSSGMCNLYSLTKGPQAIRDFARAMRGDVGNMPALPGIFPDYSAPIVRNALRRPRTCHRRAGACAVAKVCHRGAQERSGRDEHPERVLAALARWLGVESRCVVPFSSFSENEVLPDGSRPPVWFAFDESRPLAFFAGLWTRWTSVRKVKEGRDDKRPVRLPDDGAERYGQGASIRRPCRSS